MPPSSTSWLFPSVTPLGGMTDRTALRVLPSLVQTYQNLGRANLDITSGAQDLEFRRIESERRQLEAERESAIRSAGEMALPEIVALDPLDPQYSAKVREILGRNPTAAYDQAVTGFLGDHRVDRQQDALYGSGAEKKQAVAQERERRSTARSIAADQNDWTIFRDYNARVTAGEDPDSVLDSIAEQTAFRQVLVQQAAAGIPIEDIISDPEAKALYESNKIFARRLEAESKGRTANREAKPKSVSEQVAIIAQLEKMAQENPEDKLLLARLNAARKQLVDGEEAGAPSGDAVDALIRGAAAPNSPPPQRSRLTQPR